MELGLITEKQEPKSKKVMIINISFCVLVIIVFALIIFHINKAKTFIDGFLIS